MLDAEKERRRKRYKFALVRWERWGKGGDAHSIEPKAMLTHYMNDPIIVCDWEPERVLRGMLKLLKEDK